MLHRSIRRKLPLLIAALLVAVVAVVSWAAYRTVERALVAAASRDLTTAARQLAVALDESGKRTLAEGHRTATDSVIVRFLERRDVASRRALETSLDRRRAARPQRTAFEILDARRRPLLVAGSIPDGNEALIHAAVPLPRADGDTLSSSGIIARLLSANDSISLGILVPIIRRGADRGAAADTLGFVAEYRRVAGGAQVSLIRGLIGSEAEFMIGNADGDVWTNLDRAVEGPQGPQRIGEVARVAGSDSSGKVEKYGVTSIVPSTGWRVWVAMPRDTVLAPANAVLRQILLIALLVIAVGALGGWQLSRGITNPLAEVTHAAQGIAAGDYARRAAVNRSDEIGTLAASFNSMAARVEESTRELEHQATELEYQVAQSQDLAQELEASNQELTEALHTVEASRDGVAAAGRRYQHLVEHAGDLIAVVDPGGSYLYASPSHERIFGTPAGELIGSRSLDRVHPEDRATVEERISDALERPGQPVTVTYRYQHADGSWRQIEAQGVNLLHDPAVGGIVVNSRDVTTQQLLETQLLQSQKMEAVGRLAGGIAHDFNNILTAIKSYSQLAVEELEEDAPLREDVLEIDRAADRAAALTRQLLAFSRQQVLRPRVLDLNETVRGIENMLARLLMTDVSLETHLAPNLGRVAADPGQIEQVLMNLVVNARDAMPGGGQLTISTANADVGAGAHPEMGPHGFPAGAYTVLTVSDTGEGMSRETQAKVFEPFFTTKDQGKGTGLGLSTVYGIVKQSGGFIWVYSELGQGTTFKIYFPRVDATAEHEVPAAVVAPRRGGPERILIVEDDTVLRALMRRVLERSGYDIVEAANGLEALRLVGEQQASIALVISDLIMPEMRGTELLRELRSVHPGLPVLLVSGYTEDAMMRQRTFEVGTAFLEKPFTPDILVRTVRTMLDGEKD